MMLPTSLVTPATATAAPRPALDPAEQGPAWNLGDLYGSPDDSRITSDLDGAAEAATALAAEHKGRLPDLDGDGLADLLDRYETLEETLGRVYSYAQLLFAAHRDDPAVGRFFQSVQERVNDITTHLLFVTLELNRLDDAHLPQRVEASPRRPTGWGPRPASPASGLGSTRSAPTARTSSTTRSSASCTRSTSPAAPPGSACSTRPWPACASRSTART